MPLASTAIVIDTLTRGRLLTAPQLEEVRKALQRTPAPAQVLLQELVRRAWLTPFQAQQIASGRGGDLVLGPYLLLETLGQGGSGQVFKARHQKLNRLVALKIVRPELVKDPEVVQRFHREIEVASQLSHPNIVHAYEAGAIGTLLVLAMEYVDGRDLERLVQQSGPLPVDRACEYTRQAAVALQYASERGLVHRDIKPSNLLVTQQAHGSQAVGLGLVKLLDLGLARLLQPTANSRTANLTVIAGNSVMQGTPDYMAPEQALDFHSADTRADIYSLGCTLYFLLAGRPPFPGGSLAEKLMKHQQAEPSIAGLRPDLPAGLELVLRNMLAKRPADRPATPGAVALALEAFCPATDGAPKTTEIRGQDTSFSSVVGLPAAFAEKLKQLTVQGDPQRQRRRRFLLMLLAGGLCLGLVGVLLLFMFSGSPRPTETTVAVVADTVPMRIGSYGAKFQGPQPATGWRYLWNKTGPIGNPAHYVPLRWDGGSAYNGDGGAGLPRPEPAGYIYLARNMGHPGRGEQQSPDKFDRYAIAAYTLQDNDGAGVYRIVDGSIKKGNHLRLLIHVDGKPPALNRPVPPNVSPPLGFNAELGSLRPGDTVYVAVGPNKNDGSDTFEAFDYTIQRGGPDPRTRSILVQEGFEEWAPAWERRGQAEFNLDADQPHQGKKSLRIITKPDVKLAYQQASRAVDEAVVPGTAYGATFWVRTRDVKGDAGAYGYLQFVGDNSWNKIIHSKVHINNGAKGWEQLTINAVAPKEARRLIFGVVLHAHGTAWFDDVEISRTGPKP